MTFFIMMDCVLHFNILDDLSDDLALEDYYHFLSISDLTYELAYKVVKRIEYYYTTLEYVEYHDPCCNQDENCYCYGYDVISGRICLDGDLMALKWLVYNKGLTILSGDFICVCKGENLEIIKWIYESTEFVLKSKINVNTGFEHACANGRIDIAKWLVENKIVRGSIFPTIWAAKYGQLEIIKWLHEAGIMMCIDRAIYWAAKKRRYEILEWFRCNKTKDWDDAIKFADSDIMCVIKEKMTK